jgi:peptidoglycan hydrolase-like protein with peptidoglycan-binding domain
MAWLIAEATRKYGPQLVKGHRDVASTLCPGAKLYAKVPAIADISTSMPKDGGTPVSTLKKGSSGLEVRSLQILLNTFAEANLEVDGAFGPATEAAVRKYQAILRVPQDGVWGSASQTAHGAFVRFLESLDKPPTPKPANLPSGSGATLRRGSTGPDVTRLQEALVFLGTTMDVDGIFGLQTEKVIKDMQAFFKVEGGADGVVGSKTWDLIDFLYAKKKQEVAAALAFLAAQKAEAAKAKISEDRARAEREKEEQERQAAIAAAEAERAAVAAAEADAAAAEQRRLELEDLLERDKAEEVEAELERVREENESLKEELTKSKGLLSRLIDMVKSLLRVIQVS